MFSLLEKSIIEFTKQYIGEDIPAELDDCITHAVNKAYGDMTPRTIKNHTAGIKAESTAALAGWFKEYFQGASPRDEEDFKDAHMNACEVFLSSFNETARQNGVQEQAFGKAQKIVNMSFKYLYCMRRDKEEESRFKFCHMPLDTYTLNWFYRTERESGIKKAAWSNLSEDQYQYIAGRIKAHVDALFPGLSPLEAEFIIWPIEKSVVSLKELKSAISRSCSDQIITAHLGKERIMVLQEIGKAECLTFEKAYEYAKQEKHTVSLPKAPAAIQ